MRRVTLDQAKAQLSDLVDAAASGEDIFITTDDRQVVQLVPVVRPKPRPRFGSAKGLIVMTDGFDAPLPGFDSYRG